MTHRREMKECRTGVIYQRFSSEVVDLRHSNEWHCMRMWQLHPADCHAIGVGPLYKDSKGCNPRHDT